MCAIFHRHRKKPANGEQPLIYGWIAYGNEGVGSPLPNDDREHILELARLVALQDIDLANLKRRN